MNTPTINVITGPCPLCGEGGVVFDVPARGYRAWQEGAFIQNALPTLPAPLREQLMTNTHGPCWDEMFPEEDEEEEEEEEDDEKAEQL